MSAAEITTTLASSDAPSEKDAVLAAVRAAIASGLVSWSEVHNVAQEMRVAVLTPLEAEIEEAFRATAKDILQKDGELEFDDNSMVSLGDDPGAYVGAYRWVTHEDVDAYRERNGQPPLFDGEQAGDDNGDAESLRG